MYHCKFYLIYITNISSLSNRVKSFSTLFSVSNKRFFKIDYIHRKPYIGDGSPNIYQASL